MVQRVDQRHQMISGETAAVSLLAILGVFLVISSFGLGLRTNDAWVGPGTMPLVVGVSLFVIAAVRLTVRAVARYSDVTVQAMERTPADKQGHVDVLGRTAAQRIRQLWTVIAALATTIALVPLLGYLLSFGTLVIFITTFVERKRMRTAAVITTVSLLAVYAVFVMFLDVPLPQGLLGSTVIP